MILIVISIIIKYSQCLMQKPCSGCVPQFESVVKFLLTLNPHCLSWVLKILQHGATSLLFSSEYQEMGSSSSEEDRRRGDGEERRERWESLGRKKEASRGRRREKSRGRKIEESGGRKMDRSRGREKSRGRKMDGSRGRRREGEESRDGWDRNVSGVSVKVEAGRDRGSERVKPKEVCKAPMPGTWQSTERSGVPAWDKSKLKKEDNPPDWVEPPKAKVDLSLLPYRNHFDLEIPVPPVTPLENKEELLIAHEIPEDDPVVVLFPRGCVRTTRRGLKESKRARAKEEMDTEEQFGGSSRSEGKGRRGRGGVSSNMEPVSRSRGFGGGKDRGERSREKSRYKERDSRAYKRDDRDSRAYKRDDSDSRAYKREEREESRHGGRSEKRDERRDKRDGARKRDRKGTRSSPRKERGHSRGRDRASRRDN